MNALTTLQKKLVYLVIVIGLLIPVVILGRPAEPVASGSGEGSSGGTLARLRVEHQLGEPSLGQVDPASSTMNLLLLGFRGIATSMLWMDAQAQQRDKDWSALRATTDSIILLQPHFLKVWHFQGWNLAYNVSVEWDLVPDRFYWVKEGIKFFKKGTERNKLYPDLYWYTGDTIGKKIGRADESAQYRKFFREDPDTARFKGRPDPELNPAARDNYEVARDWFVVANDTIAINMEHIMAEVLFRQYPTRALMDYAAALQKEGIYDEVAQEPWRKAYEEWTTVYGKTSFDSPGGDIHLEHDPEEWARLVEQDKDLPDTLRPSNWVLKYQDMANYRYWKVRALVESGREETKREAADRKAGAFVEGDPKYWKIADAHRELQEGEALFVQADYAKAEEKLYDGMNKLDVILKRPEYADLNSDDSTIEEALIAQLFWRDCLDLKNEAPDETKGYPLQSTWQANFNRVSSLQDDFQRRKRQVK